MCELSHLVMSNSVHPMVHQAHLFKGFSKNTGVGCHSLLQGIFLTQGLNLGLLHCRRILYLLVV